MTRCVQGRHLFDDTAREVLRAMIWKVAEFCGVEVITYAIMPNHFHVLIRVPIRTPISDEELLKRYKLLHPKPSPFLPARIEVIADSLKQNSAEGGAWRQKQLALMNNVSAYMRLLKQRFSIWFNKNHDYFGTLWAERFKSVLVQYDRNTLRTIAAYIDLNAVRKGLVQDPKDYRFCGYAEALAGSKRARYGLAIICPHKSWRQILADYRTILYSIGAAPRERDHIIPPQEFETVMAADGHLSLPELLRHSWRYFTDATVLGSQAFVSEQRARFARANALPRQTTPPPPPPPTPWGNWTTFQRIRRNRYS